jgi:hypothetical protein
MKIKTNAGMDIAEVVIKNKAQPACNEEKET